MTPGWRMAAFATSELALDAFYIFSHAMNLDLDAFWIYACVANNTMRTIALDPQSARYMDADEVPEEFLPSVSRRAIADKTGLPRETVRRRVNALVERGLLVVESDGNVRVNIRQDPQFTACVNALNKAVTSYIGRLESVDINMPLPPGEGAADQEREP